MISLLLALGLALPATAKPPAAKPPVAKVPGARPPVDKLAADKPAGDRRAVQPAPIGYLTASELAARCGDSSPAATSYCFAYIAAVHDTTQAYEQWLNQREFCPPAGTPQADLRRAFLTYVVAYPQYRSGEAASVVVVALKEFYPC